MERTPTLVVGTAGHIDHGKSRLVWALTGTDPDRLPEEKARGMTIELGFAHATFAGCNISFVDVPGHERFIRNMVAGATGVDVALLVVAADDSVMPQTREHAEVLAWLGIERVLLVLTKVDLVDEDWADVVEAEARELLAGLKLGPIACVRTSAQTGRGLDELQAALAALAKSARSNRAASRWFRLPIDRSFSIAGRGTVVTGSVAHGEVRRDEELELWPVGTRVRVRDLQTHNDDCETASGRMRLAVNLAAVGVDDAARGCELASPGYLQPAQYLDVWLAGLRMPGKLPKKTLRLRMHLATSDVLAELRLLNEPGTDSVRGEFAQLRTATPVVAAWGQHFILRDESASRTLGGGRILRPHTRRWSVRRPANPDGLRTLLDGKLQERLAEVIRDSVWQALTDGQLAAAAGLVDAEEAARATRSLIDKGQIVAFEAAGQRLLIHTSYLSTLGEELLRRFQAYLKANPRIPGVPRSEWPAWMPKICPQRHRTALAEWFVAQGLVAVVADRLVPRGHKDALSADDQTLLDALLAEFEAGAFQPPGENELKCRTPKNAKRLRELMDWAATRGQLVRIADGLWLHGGCWHELIQRVTAAIRETGGVAVSDIRTLLDSSRKFVVPIAEKLDAAGITKRVGDKRILGPKADKP